MVDADVNLPDILFVWIPKTAGTSVWTHLQALGGYRVGCQYNVEPYRKKFTSGRIHSQLTKSWAYAHEFPGRGIVTYGHMSLFRLLQRQEVSQDFLKLAYTFTIVRHPVHRLVSLAADKTAGRVRKNAPNATVENVLGEIIENMRRGTIGQIGRFNSRAHSQANRQITWIRDVRRAGGRLDKIVRYEALQEGMDEVATYAGIQPFSVTRLNATPHRDPYDYFTPKTLSIVKRFYREDFELLGYNDESR